MQDESWARWVLNHAAVFGMQSQHEFATLDSWRPVFESLGYDPLELEDATDWIAKHPEVLSRAFDNRNRSEKHLAAIKFRVGELRAIEYRRAESPRVDMGTCVQCGGTGWVSVPHPQGVISETWMPSRVGGLRGMYHTACVTCGCYVGRKLTGGTEPPMSLEEYERKNPRWRTQLKDRRDAVNAEVDLSPRAREYKDGLRVRFESILRRITESPSAGGGEWTD